MTKKEQVYAEQDSGVLKKWLKLASKAESLEQFLHDMQSNVSSVSSQSPSDTETRLCGGIQGKTIR